MSKTVLVTGASGFIAQQLTLDLLAKGYTVRGTVRSLTKGEKLRAALAKHTELAANLELYEADLMDDRGWQSATSGCEGVFHVASPFPLEIPKHPDDLIVPAREGTLRVLRAAKQAGVKRVVLTSSCAAVAYGWGKDLPEVLTDDDWTKPENTADCPPYPASKAIAEKAAWDFVASEGDGLELAVINPVGVFGPIRSADVRTSVDLVYQLLEGKVPAMPKAGVQIVDVRDVSAAHIAAMEKPEAAGNRYAIADAYCTMSDVSQILREAFPNKAGNLPTKHIPDIVIRMLAPFSATVKTAAYELGRRRFVSGEKGKKLLGRDLISAEEALTASGETLIEFGVVEA